MRRKRMTLEDDLKPYRGSFVDGVGGYKVEIPLPAPLSRRARGADLVRRIRQIWYIRGEGGWKMPADRIGLLERLLGRWRGRRPQTDLESRRYWEERGGEGYEQEAFAAAWLEAARQTLKPVHARLVAEKVESVLEVGCGPGRNLTLLREFGIPRLLGLDFSGPQLEKAAGRGFPVGCASAKALPLRAASVDVVMTGQVLLHVPPPIGPAIAELVRAARRFVLLLEFDFPDAPLDSLPTANPHVFHHNYSAQVRRIAPKAERIDVGMGDVLLYRL